MKRYTPVWMLMALCAVLVVAGNAPIAPAPRAAAQEATVYPTLTPPVDFEGNGGDADWEVEEPEFVSSYPEGMSFSVKATSSGGAIESATVFWRLSPSAGKSAGGVYNEASDMWVATWNTDSDTPAWIGFQYWFVLVDEAGNRFTTTPKEDEWADNTRSWGRAESEDIIVFWERPIPDEVGNLVVEAMRKNREKYRQGYGSVLNYRPRAILYATRESYFEWQAGISEGSRTIGTTRAGWGGTVQYLYNGDIKEIAYDTVPHEVAHLYQFYTRSGTSTIWWYEGGATFFELQYSSYDILGSARKLVNAGYAKTLRNDVGRGGNGRAPYDIGYSFIRYVVETYGIEAHAEIVRLIQQGVMLINAFEQATDTDFDELQRGWRVWLGVTDTTVATLLPTLEVEFRPTPTLRTFGPRRTATPTITP